MANNSVYQIVTDRIIEQLQAGVAPWRKPWNSKVDAPKNLISGKPYRGINVWLLMGRGYASPCWLTFKQAQGLGGSVRKGEKGTPVVFYSKFDTKEVAADGTKKQAWVLRYYTVFNVAQCDGIGEVPQADAVRVLEPHDAAEQLVANMKNRPAIQDGMSAAFYRPSTDIVGMPNREDFDSADGYYATLFHELIHSTGHESRLKRDGIVKADKFGSEQYGKEELIAEMGAAFLMGETGIESHLPQSASYLKSWITTLKGDARLIVSAASAAQKAAEFVLGHAAGESAEEPAANEVVAA